MAHERTGKNRLPATRPSRAHKPHDAHTGDRTHAMQAAVHAPSSASPQTVLQMQRVYGNQAVQRLLSSASIQAKLTVGAASDHFEQEADRAADQVMRTASRSPQSKSSPAGALSAHSPRTASDTDTLQTRREQAGESFDIGGEFARELAASRGGGQPLPDGARAEMESSFGADFGRVRVHSDGNAARLSRSISAQAFTRGSDIYMGAGQYAPGTSAGKHLLAHELAHVVQQSGGSRAASLRVQRQAGGAIQRKLDGSIAVLDAVSTHGRGWNQVRTYLRSYEQMEREQVQRVSAYARLKEQTDLVSRVSGNMPINNTRVGFAQQVANGSASLVDQMAAIRAHEKPMTVVLGRLRASILAWLGRGKHQRSLEQYQNDPDELTVRRRQALEMLLPRVELEINEIAEGRFAKSVAPKLNVLQEDAVGGALNKLDLVKVGEQEAYFKPEKGVEKSLVPPKPDEVAGPMVETGISAQNPQQAARSIAMYRLDQLLQVNIIAKTEFAVSLRTNKATNQKSPVFGAVMERVKGGHGGTVSANMALSSAEKSKLPADAVSAEDPVLQRGLNKLQMLDALCGQVDRHMGNYYVEKDASGRVIGVKGIDNDLAFGAVISRTEGSKNKREIPVTDPSARGLMQYRGLPPVVDAETAERILNINFTDVRMALRGLIAPAEIDATLARLTKMKTQLADMKQKKLFVSDWGGANLSDAHGFGQTYLGAIKSAALSNKVEDALKQSQISDFLTTLGLQGKQLDTETGNLVNDIMDKVVTSMRLTPDQALTFAGGGWRAIWKAKQPKYPKALVDAYADEVKAKKT